MKTTRSTPVAVVAVVMLSTVFISGCPEIFPCMSDADCRFCGGETCNSGTFICEDGIDPCATPDVCDEFFDVCWECSDTTPCDDANACTDDSCLDGVCSSVAVCGAGETCSGGVCSVDDPCSDDTECNACFGERCINGLCTPGPPVVCDDGDACTDDECVFGKCVFTASPSCVP